MKALKTIILLVFSTAIMSAQDLKPSEVPKTVMLAFMKDFSIAADVDWERDREYYKAEFEINWMDYEIWYTKEGRIHRREQEITELEVPEAVLDEIVLNYTEYYIESVIKIWQDNITTYKVDLESGDDSWEVIFDIHGRVLEERID